MITEPAAVATALLYRYHSTTEPLTVVSAKRLNTNPIGIEPKTIIPDMLSCIALTTVSGSVVEWHLA